MMYGRRTNTQWIEREREKKKAELALCKGAHKTGLVDTNAAKVGNIRGERVVENRSEDI